MLPLFNNINILPYLIIPLVLIPRVTTYSLVLVSWYRCGVWRGCLCTAPLLHHRCGYLGVGVGPDIGGFGVLLHCSPLRYHRCIDVGGALIFATTSAPSCNYLQCLVDVGVGDVALT